MREKLPPFVICPVCKLKMTNLTEDDYEDITPYIQMYVCRKCRTEFLPGMEIKGEKKRKWQ